jgi:hypothetical protein
MDISSAVDFESSFSLQLVAHGREHGSIKHI